MLKFPYAVRNFNKLITDGYVYLDRTDRIPLLENLGSELLFLRPRRFGKSLWLSTLMNYYDVNRADDFERLFGHLAVGQKPTPLHNQYLVMKWDFSAVRSHGSIEQIEADLHQWINVWVSIFSRENRDLLTEDIPINPNALSTFAEALSVVSRTPYKLYLFIDEYDNFANEVMTGAQGDNHKRYQDLISSEGMFKTLFKNVKMAGSEDGLDRVFMTGVTPIVMNDVSSGANVNEDITWLPWFNDLCGFSSEEVLSLVRQMADQGQLGRINVEETLEQMRIFYNGSRFITFSPNHRVEDVPPVYNPTLVFYFLRHIQRFGMYPENMLDNNLAPDYNKLVYISTYSGGEQILTDALDEEKPVTVSDLDDRWGVQDMLKPDQQKERLAALLCYLGAMTVKGKSQSGKLILTIPNLVMRKLYAERILELILPSTGQRDEGIAVADALFAHGTIAPLCSFVEQHLLTVYDNRDYKDFNELTLKTLFIALLQYNNLYIMDSEPALQRRYADLTMIIRQEMRHYSIFDLLIEFKYVGLSDVQNLSGQEIREKSSSELFALEPVKAKLSKARQQLHAYRHTLEQKYGSVLKLRSYIVIGVGFERVLWEEQDAGGQVAEKS